MKKFTLLGDQLGMNYVLCFWANFLKIMLKKSVLECLFYLLFNFR